MLHSVLPSEARSRGTFWFILVLLFDGGADAELVGSLELDFLEEFVVPDPLKGARWPGS